MSKAKFTQEDKSLISEVLRPLSVAYAKATNGHFPDVIDDTTLAIKDFIQASDRDGAMAHLQEMLEATPFKTFADVTPQAVTGHCTNG